MITTKQNKTITTQEQAKAFIESKGFKVNPSFDKHLSISKDGQLYNIIKENELIKQAEYLKGRTYLLQNGKLKNNTRSIKAKLHLKKCGRKLKDRARAERKQEQNKAGV